MPSELKEQQIKVVARPESQIGIDTNNQFIDDIIGAAQIGTLDVSSIDALSNSSQSRERTYELLDAMAQDDVISAVLETYAEDAIQTNDKSESIWIESSNSNVLNYTSWLLDSLNIQKQLFQWAHCLVTYGDVYVRLYRKSDQGNDLLFENDARRKTLNEKLNKDDELEILKSNSKELNEDVKIVVYGNNDPYVNYVEMVPNPGEIFDLQKFGKTHGYIKAPIRSITTKQDELYTYLTRYQVKKTDVEVYDAMSFAHGCLENTNQRQPETVDIFIKNTAKNNSDKIEVEESEELAVSTSYSVKRGQSILYNSFRIWRELNLLEMSALLNRLTKSSVVRVLNVDVGDMPKEQVQVFMKRLKEKIEQKSAINAGSAMAEYNNPGPIENTIYVPTHGGQGQINATSIGGDFDPKSLVDLEYFRDKLFGSLKVPKQFFGFTADGAGFDGGKSLSILSSRYGKTINKIQQILCQLVTDIINLYLIDRNLDTYVNQFTVRMQAPVTQEELDRRTNTDNRIRYINDIMSQLSDIEDKSVKLNIYKSLLTNVVNDPKVISYLELYIKTLEPKEESEEESQEDNKATDEDIDTGFETEAEEPMEEEVKIDDDFLEIINEEDKTEDDSYLLSPADLGLNLLSDDDIEK